MEAAVGMHVEVEVEGGSWYPATLVDIKDTKVRGHCRTLC